MSASVNVHALLEALELEAQRHLQAANRLRRLIVNLREGANRDRKKRSNPCRKANASTRS